MTRSLWLAFLGVSVPLSLGGCQPAVSTPSSNGLTGSTTTVTSYSSAASQSTPTFTYTPASGSAYTSFTVNLGSGFLAANISSTATIFGLKGAASCAASGTSIVLPNASLIESGAHRNSTTAQMSAAIETSTYAGSDWPSGYRDVPIVALDNDGGDNTGSFNPYSPGLPLARQRGVAVWDATNTPRVVCGMGVATITGRIADCDTRHTTKPTWDAVSGDGRLSWNGSMSGQGLGPEGSWTLVTVYSSALTNGTVCNSSCLEIWRDDRTGLLWSDRLGSPTSTTVNTATFNWCIASGNMENAGTVDCTAGVSGYNTASISLCAEATGLTTPAGISSSVSNSAGAAPAATWGPTGTAIRDAKGGMLKTANSDPAGAAQSPGVRWRLPTMMDFYQAEIDGIRAVLPNFATLPLLTANSPIGVLATAADQVWTATIYADTPSSAWIYSTNDGVMVQNQLRISAHSVHCVGR